ncbi:ABC transporter ATP-binding protein [Leucobacter sp. W1478]|uniref:ABC transporter ATP-binding protein n=1 Tax=Leucobacter sp. W1478 TaxID=3439065 RepID=UPI003F2F97A1
MSWVTLDGVRVSYGSQMALDGINLAIPQGEIVAILGPSGCGKTTLLRSIAGLLPVSEGKISLGGRIVSSTGATVAPERRGIGWVPQDSSLFPHLSVSENIGFGIPRGHDRAERIRQLASMVGLLEHLDRAPSQLSGGQAQRVSLARALAIRPAVLLLDEPFAALDPMLRSALRTEVAELLRSQSSTAILVTHDQEEALSLADHIAVMMGGRILQWGTPVEVYERPTTSWVARFVGSTVELPGLWQGGRVSCALGMIEAVLMDEEVAEGDTVRIVVRPEWIAIGAGEIEAVVRSVSYSGHDGTAALQLLDGTRVRARLAATELPSVGDCVRLSVRRSALVYR